MLPAFLRLPPEIIKVVNNTFRDGFSLTWGPDGSVKHAMLYFGETEARAPKALKAATHMEEEAIVLFKQKIENIKMSAGPAGPVVEGAEEDDFTYDVAGDMAPGRMGPEGVKPAVGIG